VTDRQRFVNVCDSSWLHEKHTAKREREKAYFMLHFFNIIFAFEVGFFLSQSLFTNCKRDGEEERGGRESGKERTCFICLTFTESLDLVVVARVARSRCFQRTKTRLILES
jgi:hypothetical protein